MPAAFATAGPDIFVAAISRFRLVAKTNRGAGYFRVAMGKAFHGARGMCSLTMGENVPHTVAMSLLESTQQRLDRCTAAGLSLRAIAEGSGGRINYEWLKKFAAGKIENPGVTTIEDLNHILIELGCERKRTRNPS